ncbi:hypothetical conserved protein [Oceanobacillus iheyensis HTE831]|uniref:Hypothetical conserved protein n=1 Tax=Oceanobacillus iheyensis (strain DSM 14371 / CIP 107618 / JCM 11309 / KCTC 3954 / HTE831) TaxID=221109 RepID=Q8ENY2_OCEIH|nr:hypothetical conserved protein [Oceanobacillus iheyensis HTE831]
MKTIYSPRCSLITSATPLRASSSSFPSAETSISAPFGIPKDITPMIDFKLTCLPLYETSISESNCPALFTNKVAGRACTPVSAVIVNVCDFITFHPSTPYFLYDCLCLSIITTLNISHKPTFIIYKNHKR